MTAIVSFLGDHVEILSGFAFESKYFNDEGRGLPLIRIRNVLNGSSDTFYDGRFDSRFMIQPGEIVIGMDGEFNRARWGGDPSLLNQRVCRIRSTSPNLDDQYLFYFLPSALKLIEDRTPFVTVKHLSSKDIASIPIPLPPLEEQRRIAEILEQADNLRRKRRLALERLGSLLRAKFHELFGDVRSNSKRWNTSTLGEVSQVKWGNTSITKASYSSSGVPAYSATGFDGFLPEAEFDGEGIVLSAIGARCGKCFYIPSGEWTAIKNTITITPKSGDVTLRFLYAIINDESFWPNRGAGQPFITQAAARAQIIPVPPIDLQRAYLSYATTLARLESQQQASLKILNTLFASLQHHAFADTVAPSSAAATLGSSQRIKSASPLAV